MTTHYDDVHERLSIIEPTATISHLAVIGSPGEWVGRATTYPVTIGHMACVREFARVHAGCERYTIIGDETLLMSGAHVGHDAWIGKRCHLAPNVVIGGLAEVDDDTHVGLSAVVLPRVKVGKRCIIGAGSVVTKDVPDGQVWAGNPAKYMKDTDT